MTKLSTIKDNNFFTFFFPFVILLLFILLSATMFVQ